MNATQANPEDAQIIMDNLYLVIMIQRTLKSQKALQNTKIVKVHLLLNANPRPPYINTFLIVFHSVLTEIKGTRRIQLRKWGRKIR